MAKSLFNSNSPIMHFFKILCDLFILNLLFVLTSLPVITIGASISSLYNVTMKMVRKEDVSIVKNYFSVFKRDWKQSTLSWMTLFVIGSFLVFDFFLLNALIANSAIKLILFTLLSVATIVFLIIEQYLFPYIARFQDNLKDTLKNSLYMGMINFSYSIYSVLFAIVFFFFFFSSPQTFGMVLSILLLFGFSVIAYVKSFFLVKGFKKYE